MSACTLPERTQAEVLDRPDFSAMILGAGREEAMRDLLTSPAIETNWLFEAGIDFLTGEVMELEWADRRTKAGTHHRFFDGSGHHRFFDD